ncbi:hypothetical protein DLREEDagr8_16120 [Dongia sp. agr-C8]
MAKDAKTSQLSLELKGKPQDSLTQNARSSVYTFTDAKTATIRRNAIRHVERAGIFTPPRASDKK